MERFDNYIPPHFDECNHPAGFYAAICSTSVVVVLFLEHACNLFAAS